MGPRPRIPSSPGVNYFCHHPRRLIAGPSFTQPPVPSARGDVAGKKLNFFPFTPLPFPHFSFIPARLSQIDPRGLNPARGIVEARDRERRYVAQGGMSLCARCLCGRRRAARQLNRLDARACANGAGKGARQSERDRANPEDERVCAVKRSMLGNLGGFARNQGSRDADAEDSNESRGLFYAPFFPPRAV